MWYCSGEKKTYVWEGANGLVILITSQICYSMRIVEVLLSKSDLMPGYNMPMIINTSLPPFVLQKKYYTIGYNNVRETIAADILHLVHISYAMNIADIMTKSLTNQGLHTLAKRTISRQPAHVKAKMPGHKARRRFDLSLECNIYLYICCLVV